MNSSNDEPNIAEDLDRLNSSPELGLNQNVWGCLNPISEFDGKSPSLLLSGRLAAREEKECNCLSEAVFSIIKKKLELFHLSPILSLSSTHVNASLGRTDACNYNTVGYHCIMHVGVIMGINCSCIKIIDNLEQPLAPVHH